MNNFCKRYTEQTGNECKSRIMNVFYCHINNKNCCGRYLITEQEQKLSDYLDFKCGGLSHSICIEKMLIRFGATKISFYGDKKFTKLYDKYNKIWNMNPNKATDLITSRCIKLIVRSVFKYSIGI